MKKNPFISIVLVIYLAVLKEVSSQNDWQSPCPRLFVYETTGQRGTWNGIFNLVSKKDLGGIWFRLEFDRPIIKVETTFGEELVRKNSTLFLIKSPKTPLPARTPTPVIFSVQYDESNGPAKLSGAFLNSEKVCPEEAEATTVAPVKHVAYGVNTGNNGTYPTQNTPTQGRPTLPEIYFRNDNDRVPSPVTNSHIIERARPTQPPAEDDDDDGIYPGDIALSMQHDLSEFEQNCGTVVVPPTPLITHGQPSKAGEFPWHAALYKVKNTQYICGGSLVSENFVVTAAHCVTHSRTGAAVHPKHFQVLLGKYRSGVFEFSANIQASMVVQVIPHREYNSRTFRNDIALLKLSEAAVLTDFVRPICLWEGNNDITPLHNQLGTICGWGFDETLKTTSELKQAKMPVVSKATCLKSNPKFAMYVSDLSYCAGLRNGTSACNGDSGGGMVFPKREDPNRWVLRGVVSISLRSQGRGACDVDNYAVFTDAAKYTGWIKENIKPKLF